MDKLTQQLAADTAVVKSPSPSLDDKPCASGDQVIMIDKNGTEVKGKVRWKDRHKKIDVLGIEAVSNPSLCTHMHVCKHVLYVAFQLKNICVIKFMKTHNLSLSTVVLNGRD